MSRARAGTGITRRTFIGSSAAAVAAAGLMRSLRTNVATTAARFGIPTPWHQRPGLQVTHTVCDMCPWHCGIDVSTIDGEIVKIDGNPLDPKSNGMLCAKGQGGVSFVNDPDRLKRPQIRTGERGAGEFRDATWEEALDLIAGRMLEIADESGPESVAFLGHSGGDTWFVEYLAQAWGSPNAAKPSSSLCTSPREEAMLLTTGFPVGGHEPVDWDEIGAFALIGSHIGEDTRNTVMQGFSTAMANGAELVVVDPRFSTAASKADMWLPIKPGTDTALLLAWINTVLEEGLIDEPYLEEWATGLDALVEHTKEFTADWAAPITELAADQIRESARMLARRRPKAAIVPGRHVTWYGNDTQRMRAVFIFNALLGAYGRRGGLYLNSSPYIEAYPHPPFAVAGSAGGCSAEPGEESSELPLGPSGKARADGVRDRFLRGSTALQELIDPMITGEPYPIRALIAYGINLLHSIPDPERTKDALRNLDLVVAIDVLPQEHIAWADVVLPESTYLERHDDLWTVSHRTPYVALREPAIEPMYDTKPGWWIARELGLRLGLDGYFRWETAEDWLNTRLRSVGSSVEKLRDAGGVIVQDGAPYLEDRDSSPFLTESSKIELYSHTLEVAGLDPIPVYEPVEDPPEGFQRLLYGRHPAHTFAKTQNTPTLRALHPENEVWIASTVADDLGVQSGDKVVLVNQDGARSLPVSARATERIRPDAVYMVHGYGHDAPGLTGAHRAGASDTKLQTRYALDPISGGAGMRVNFVRVEKAS